MGSQINSPNSTELKILAIIGSPRGKASNGYKAIQKIEVEMNKLGSTSFTYLFLNELNLKSCLGCFTCISKGENLCPLKDDKAKIETLIETHAGLILSSPGYVQNVSALMKNFIDRFGYTHHRPRYFNKKVVLLANGGAGLNKTLEALSIAIGGPQIITKLDIAAPPWPIKEKVKQKNKQKTQEASKKFYAALQNKKLPKPSFNNLMIFKFFKSASKDCQTWLPADYTYYKDLKGYFYETKINPIKNGFASLMFKIVIFLMRDMGPELHKSDPENIPEKNA
jgi:multimeric flavodoxin WrbA